jgi:hypothetical protein
VSTPDCHEYRLAQLDARALRSIRRDSIRVSPDRSRAAYVLDPGTAVVDGIPGPSFDHVEGLEFAPDGARVAYVAVMSGRRHVVLQGMAGTTTIGEPVDEVLSTVVFSPDGASCSYTARVGARYRVLVDDECVHDQPFIAGHDAMIDAPGPRFPFPDHWGAVTDAESAILLQRMGAFAAGQRVVGPNGRHWIHARERPVASSGAWTIIVDGLLTPRCLEAEGPVFSSDGESVAYWAKERTADHECIVVNGRPGPIFSAIPRLMPFGLRACFTPETGHLLYKGQRRMRWFAVVDGEPGPELDWLGEFAVAADGSHIGFPAILESEIRWMIRGW